jgi:hypothetical protein
LNPTKTLPKPYKNPLKMKKKKKTEEKHNVKRSKCGGSKA